MKEVKLKIQFTDGEIVKKEFVNLSSCLCYLIKTVVAAKEEYVDKITIEQ